MYVQIFIIKFNIFLKFNTKIVHFFHKKISLVILAEENALLFLVFQY